MQHGSTAAPADAEIGRSSLHPPPACPTAPLACLPKSGVEQRSVPSNEADDFFIGDFSDAHRVDNEVKQSGLAGSYGGWVGMDLVPQTRE